MGFSRNSCGTPVMSACEGCLTSERRLCGNHGSGFIYLVSLTLVTVGGLGTRKGLTSRRRSSRVGTYDVMIPMSISNGRRR